MSRDIRRMAIGAVASFDQIEAGLRRNDPRCIAIARTELHEMVDESNAWQLCVLLMAPRLLAEMVAKQHKEPTP